MMEQKQSLQVVEAEQDVAATAEEDSAQMSLVEHLGEFRNRLITALIVWVVTTVACLYFVEFFIGIILRPAVGYTLISITPTELIVEYMKVALITGLILASPVILYQIWGFIRPGMKKKERKTILSALFAGLVFFIVGVVFCYTLMLPLVLQFLQGLDSTQTIDPMISISSYISFVLSGLLTFGLVFEMPVLAVLLTQLGILKPEWLIKSRKTAIVVIFVMAALITPPDIMSQMMIGAPMIVLYEISVMACKVIVMRKNKKKKPQPTGA